MSTGYDNYSTHVAIAVGVISIIVYTAYSLLLARLGIDDPLDVVAGILLAMHWFQCWLTNKIIFTTLFPKIHHFCRLVHFGGGSLGLIAVAFFHEKYGIFYAWNLQSAYVSDFEMLLVRQLSIYSLHFSPHSI